MRRGMPPGAVELSYLEKRVLLVLGDRKKTTPEEIRSAGRFRELPEEAIDPKVLRDLKSRRDLIRERESVRREIALTPAGERVLAAGIDLKEEVAQPTTDLLRSGKWKQVDFRRYDARAFAPLVRPGKRHVL